MKEKKINFLTDNKCHIYNKFYPAKDIKVKDLSHMIGKYKGFPHQICNADYRFTKDTRNIT